MTPDYIKEFDETFVKISGPAGLPKDWMSLDDMGVRKLEAFIKTKIEEAEQRGRNQAIRYVEENIVAIDENPVEARTLQLDTDKLADLLESARTIKPLSIITLNSVHHEREHPRKADASGTRTL